MGHGQSLFQSRRGGRVFTHHSSHGYLQQQISGRVVANHGAHLFIVGGYSPITVPTDSYNGSNFGFLGEIVWP